LEVPAGNDFIDIAAGKNHNLALKSDGSIIAWGLNDDGQCDVPSGSGFVEITADYHHSVAIIPEPVTLSSFILGGLARQLRPSR
jgi:hypothetical protein